MSKCRMCNTHMTEEDLLCDDQYCLSCINGSDGEDEDYGVLHNTRIPGGHLYLIRQKSAYIVDVVSYQYEAETESHLRSRHNNSLDASDRYLDVLRNYI